MLIYSITSYQTQYPSISSSTHSASPTPTMGIQALVCVRHNGNWVVAQHCNWDGFPTGQGLTLFKFLREETNVTSLRTGLGYTYEATDEKLAEMNQALRDERERLRRQGPAALYEFVTSRRQFLSALPRGPYGEASAQAYFDVFDLATEMFPSLSRNTGAKVLRLIADANRQNAVPIKLDLEFASGTYHCPFRTASRANILATQILFNASGRSRNPRTRHCLDTHEV
ncbi:hypothetical protein GGR53DRAFT_489069 [Hypoxylon sp. FL1150]|nr:hypothetical protein GGR53DRAFT_489069 [Hypoxylon sp. FL1150]